MTFTLPKESNPGRIAEVKLGAAAAQGGSRTEVLTVGGATSSPFHFFEGDHPHPPLVAMEVFDKIPEKYPPPLRKAFKGVLDDSATMAKRCVDEHGADLISLRLDGTHPEKGDLTPDSAAEKAQGLLESVKVPLIFSGHSHFARINEVFKKICEVTAGENCLINYVETDNYKTIAAACIAYDHTLVAQTPIDVNLAKQLNILLTDMDFPRERIVLDPMTSTLGYGVEYTYSIMERIRNDGLAGDAMLGLPMLVNPGYETFKIKEARTPEAEIPDWGDIEDRFVYWETATAVSLLAAGAELLILYHPRTVATVKTKIAEIWTSKEGD